MKDKGEGHDEEHPGTGSEDAVVEGDHRHGCQRGPGAPSPAQSLRAGGTKAGLEGHEDTHRHHEHDDERAHDVLVEAGRHARAQPGAEESHEDIADEFARRRANLAHQGKGGRGSSGDRSQLVGGERCRRRQTGQHRHDKRNQNESPAADERIDPTGTGGPNEQNGPLP